MSFRCPGYLNAKSLSEDGECREDYVEWFSNPVLSPYRPLIDAVYGAMQYRGDDPVLLACDVSSESCLLFRFTMKSQDRKGRNHQRCEVMKVAHSELPALLNGEFKAVPDEESMEFVVDGVAGAALPQCERHGVKNEMFNVYARNQRAYWFNGEVSSPIPSPKQQTPPRQQPTVDSSRTIRSGRVVDYPQKGEKIMSKVLFALLIVSCVFGGWNYFQTTGEIELLRTSLRARDSEIAGHRVEIEGLRKENDRLKGEIDKFDKWIKTRSNFDLNKVQLKIKIDEIIKDCGAAKDLLTHMDETPNPTSEKEPGIVSSDASGMASKTNNVPTRVDISRPQHDDSNQSGDKKKGKKKDKGITDWFF